MASVGDILRATVSFDLAAADIGNMVFTFTGISGSETDYDAIAAAVEAALALAFSDIETDMSLGINPLELLLNEWDFVLNQWDGKATEVATFPDGSEAGENLPQGIASVVRFVTEARRRQARKFIPGIPEAHCNNDNLSNGYVTNLILTAIELNNDIVAGGITLRPCVFNDTPADDLFETHSKFIQTSIVNTRVGYQRRRQTGAGI